MATPLVTGAVALLLQKWPDLKPSQIKSVLMRKARDLGIGPNLQGAGALDLEAIFEKESIPKEPKKNEPEESLGGLLLKTILKMVFSNLSSGKQLKGTDLFKMAINLFGNLK